MIQHPQIGGETVLGSERPVPGEIDVSERRAAVEP